MKEGLFFLAYTHSPLHAGIGQAMGKVDLPIEREKHTTYPCVYATGLKGALRMYCEKNTSDLDLSNGDVEEIFGKSDASAGAGGAMFTDLKILLFPVRSSKDSFKWVTCPHVLRRFKRDYQTAGGTDERVLNLTIETKIIEDGKYDAKDHILLEDFVFEYKEKDPTNKTFLDMEEILLSDIYAINDLTFKHLVNNATQIIARNKLNEDKTSENLWYEETLPADTVMYSFILPSVVNSNKLSELKKLDKEICQIGGNETVGYGLTELHFMSMTSEKKDEDKEKKS